ncbi:MAG: DUF3159 domain-containing protein [Micrococcaceae bacterium]
MSEEQQEITSFKQLFEHSDQSMFKSDEDGNISLIKSMGGFRGVAETVLPSLVFVLLFFLTRNVTVSVICALAVALGFFVLRLVQKTPVVQAVFGVAAVIISGTYANFKGEANAYYVPGFFINSSYLAVSIISVLIGWPLLGIVLGVLFGEGTDWKKHKKRYKLYKKATLIFAAMFAFRLIVELPLYFSGEKFVDYLGMARLLTGVPLYALTLWFIWNLVKSVPAITPEPKENSQAK